MYKFYTSRQQRGISFLSRWPVVMKLTPQAVQTACCLPWNRITVMIWICRSRQTVWTQIILSRSNLIRVYSKCSKISNTKKERTPCIYFLSSPVKQREVTNFAKWGNLIASLCKIGYFPLVEIKILLYTFLEYLPYHVSQSRLFAIPSASFGSITVW